MSHRAGTRRVPPVLRSRFYPVFVSFSFSYRSAPSFSIVKRLAQSHYISRHTHTHTHSHTLTLSHEGSHGANALSIPPLCLRAPPSGSRTRIGHIPDHPRTHSVDTPSTLHYQSVCTRRTNVSTPQQTILPVAIILLQIQLGFELARLARACSGASHWLVIRLKTRHLLDVVLFPVF